MMIRVLIADDHSIVREGIKQIFALVENLVVAGEAANGEEADERLAQGGVDLLLLDMTMPGSSGEELISRLRARYPDLPVLVLSMHNDPMIALRALKAGADGYLAKDCNPGTLLDAIHKVAAGSRFLDPKLAEQAAFNAVGIEGPIDHNALSKREFEVMRLLADGLGVNHIADRLAISNKTVSTYKSLLMKKMGFTSSADIIRYAITHRLAE